MGARGKGIKGQERFDLGCWLLIYTSFCDEAMWKRLRGWAEDTRFRDPIKPAEGGHVQSRKVG